MLDLYAEEADARRPVVCFDESPTQLIGEVREPISAAPGQPECYDLETNWHALIPTPPKSHNHCAEVLAVFLGLA